MTTFPRGSTISQYNPTNASAIVITIPAGLTPNVIHVVTAITATIEVPAAAGLFRVQVNGVTYFALATPAAGGEDSRTWTGEQAFPPGSAVVVQFADLNGGGSWQELTVSWYDL